MPSHPRRCSQPVSFGLFMTWRAVNGKGRRHRSARINYGLGNNGPGTSRAAALKNSGNGVPAGLEAIRRHSPRPARSGKRRRRRAVWRGTCMARGSAGHAGNRGNEAWRLVQDAKKVSIALRRGIYPLAQCASFDEAQRPTRHRSPTQLHRLRQLQGRFRRTHDTRPVELCLKRY